MTKTHDKQCSTLCLQHHLFVLFHCFSGFSQLFDPQNKVIEVYPTTKSRKFSWQMVLEIIQISTISMIFLDFARKTCDSTSRSDIFASRRSMTKSLIPRGIYIIQRIIFFLIFFRPTNSKCKILFVKITTFE